ncbi:MAG: hypothetical protein KAX49_18310 [Halanaerobiales bacterium]|nr:hypothetical protein [Halanaerobiales bacterium]
MYFRKLTFSIVFLIFLSVTVQAAKIESIGEQYINTDLGEVKNVIIADTITNNKPNGIEVKGLMEITDLSYYTCQDGDLDFLVSMIPKVKGSFGDVRAIIYSDRGEVLLKNLFPRSIISDGGKRFSWIFSFPFSIINSTGKYYIQVYVPKEQILELFLVWPITVGEIK